MSNQSKEKKIKLSHFNLTKSHGLLNSANLALKCEHGRYVYLYFSPEEGICPTKQTIKARSNSHWTEIRRYRLDREIVRKKGKKKNSKEAKIQ